MPTELGEKAARWRAEAERAQDGRQKQSFLELAEAYETLAERLSHRASTAAPASRRHLRLVERNGDDV